MSEKPLCKRCSQPSGKHIIYFMEVPPDDAQEPEFDDEWSEEWSGIFCAPEHVVGQKLQFLIDHMNSLKLLEDGCFTFPDGEVWLPTSREL